MQTVETCLVFIERLAATCEDWKALDVLKELGTDGELSRCGFDICSL
jgi:hypothetical protein